MSSPVGAAVAGAAGLGTATAGALVDSSRENAKLRQLAQIRSNMAGYAEIYRKEASFRAKENASASSS